MCPVWRKGIAQIEIGGERRGRVGGGDAAYGMVRVDDIQRRHRIASVPAVE